MQHIADSGRANRHTAYLQLNLCRSTADRHTLYNNRQQIDTRQTESMEELADNRAADKHTNNSSKKQKAIRQQTGIQQTDKQQREQAERADRQKANKQKIYRE